MPMQLSGKSVLLLMDRRFVAFPPFEDLWGQNRQLFDVSGTDSMYKGKEMGDPGCLNRLRRYRTCSIAVHVLVQTSK